MRVVDIIIKKRDKGELTLEEIEFFIRALFQEMLRTTRHRHLQWRSCSMG